MITARNSVGEGSSSSICIGQLSTVPNCPTVIQSVDNNDYCDISWTAGYNGGQSITMYYIMIQTGDGIQYLQE